MTRLLDINVLLALAWPQHVHHARINRWARSQKSGGRLHIATCPITQLGFLRVSMNVKGYAVDFPSAAQFLTLLLDREEFEHAFWPDDLSVFALEKSRTEGMGPNQLTDTYLSSLAEKRHGRLLTLDTGIKGASVELVPL